MILNFKNIGMIQEAKINIDKLTIIAGQNDSGKSTIGKVLFAISNGMINLDKTFKIYKESAIKNILNEIANRLEVSSEYKEFDFSLFDDIYNFDRIFGIENIEKELFIGNTEVLDKLENYLYKVMLKEDIDIYLKDLSKIIKYTEKDEIIQKNALNHSLNLEFHNQINNVFSNEPAEIQLEMDNRNIVDLEIRNNQIFKVKQFRKIYTRDISYIEGPFIFNNLSRNNTKSEQIKNRMKNLEEKINSSYTYQEENYIEASLVEDKFKKFETMLNNSIGGIFKYSEKSKNFILEKDGNEIIISNIAMGVKSIAILNILLNIKFFKKDNILIIDEPEVHLHPKWQIEYARIITNLAKVFDTKILITTHSPYMIEAFDKFSQKEKISKNTNFYMLKKEKNTSIVKEVNSNLEEIYKELGSAFNDLDNLILGDL